ncbi:ArsR/SmtB family transcription factor [Sneathiella limimaris]|uniref:ArsR/SmtB family transcription factor n=1 Tax=Sneathiella limimaris TaxID=1964213 RepID=UPI0019CF6423|nr:metalloregulator ArsR/SmtB family transcription factor [Sneathiella limimaris]
MAKSLAELGNETRLEIFRILIKAEPKGLNISGIKEKLDIPASTLAFHLKGLVDAGLVYQTKEGRSVCCRANLERVNTIIRQLIEDCCLDNLELEHE